MLRVQHQRPGRETGEAAYESSSPMHVRASSQQVRLILGVLYTLMALGILFIPSSADIAVAEDIFIDPGHGGRYPGAYYAGVSEASVNLLVSLAVREELRERGHNTNMSRTTSAFADPGDIPTWHYWDPDGDDIHYVQYAKDGRTGIYDYSPDEDSGSIPYDDLQKRCDLANDWGADLFVSIHANASTSSSARGLETYHNWDNTTDLLLSKQLAELVQQEIVIATGMPDRKVDDVGYYVIRWSNMPGILIETGFLSNALDRSFLLNPTFRTRMAEGIVNGIERFLATDPFQPLNERIMGATRYGTAVAVSQEGWPTGADTVLLASGENWPDSLAAVPLSTELNAPILLTQSSILPTDTANALGALAPSRIVIVGGEAAVGSEVASAAAAAASLETSTGVARIAGHDRYDTAAAVATTLSPSADVIVVSGEAFPDAVSASAYAGRMGFPVLLTRRSGISTPTLSWLDERSGDIDRAIVVGGSSVIGDGAFAQLQNRMNTTRVWGSNRYTTNLALIKRFWPIGEVSPMVATADTFPDALVAGTLAAKQNRPIMLLGRKYLNPYQREWLRNDADRIGDFTMIGGEQALDPLMDWELDKGLARNRFDKD